VCDVLRAADMAFAGDDSLDGQGPDLAPEPAQVCGTFVFLREVAEAVHAVEEIYEGVVGKGDDGPGKDFGAG